MLENLRATKGLIFSGQLLLALTNKGLSRETAYEYVQRNAMRVWDEDRDFQELVKADDDIKSQLSVAEIERIFSLDHYLRNMDAIYRRRWLVVGYFAENFSAKFPITGSLKYWPLKALTRHRIKPARMPRRKTPQTNH